MDPLRARPLVLARLQQAVSQQAAVLKPAELQLQQWEKEPGFYSILMVILTLSLFEKYNLYLQNLSITLCCLSYAP